MFRRVILNASFKRNYLVITGKVKQNGISNNLKFKLCLPQFSEAHLTQSRFCSTNSSGSGLHKVFFVNAESPPATDKVESLSATNSVEYIPPPPLPPDITEESLNTLNALGEPTFQSLGLAGWSPIGLLQSCIEQLHVTLGLPWWGSIAVATVIMRMCLSPLVVMSQRNAAKMNNHMPTIQHIQMKLTEARNSGNNLEAARLGYEMQQFMKKVDINPIRSMLVPLAQAPIFISMFIGLRRCANLPVESFKDGGMLWFTDLTMNDPFYILPVITSLTMFATIELGAEGQQVSNQTSKLARTFLRCLPLIIFPFTLHFPSVSHASFPGMDFREEADGPPSGEKDPQATFVIGCSDEDFDQELVEEDEILHVVPPDGGWGWVVVAASFMCNAVVDGIIFTSGMLFPKLREAFGASNSQVAWISSLLGGFYLLVGPFVSALANAFGFRTVCILGAVLAACSCVLSYFATSIYFLYGSFGILGGMGFGLIYVPAVIATGFYFEKRRALATGIAVCGSGIGTFVLSPLNAYLLTSLGDDWQFIFLVYAGIVLSCAFYGLAFRPLSPSTGKSVVQDDGLEVNGTPLLMRIKRARDQELAQCPSALSMNSAYSRSPSNVNLEQQHPTLNGDIKIQPVARTLLERHGGVAKRFSYPGFVATGPEPILEEAENVGADDDSDTKESNTSTSEEAGQAPNATENKKEDGNETSDKNDQLTLTVPDQKTKSPEAMKGKPLLLDNNKNETPVNTAETTVNTDLTIEANQLLENRNRKCPRNMSAPVLHLPHNLSAEHRRRPSRVALRTEVSRPFYRDDIFYSGSLARLPQYQSSNTVNQYHASVTNLPPMYVLAEDEEKGGCSACAVSLKSVLGRIFDFSLLSSVTFIFLSLSGFLALMSLFVPFNFLPSYTTDLGIEPSETSFLMSLIGICNTVGRIIAGWVSDHPKVDALLVNNLALIAGGGATILLPFISDLSLLYLYAIIFGLSVAAFASLRSILLVELLGLEKLTNAFGLLLLFQGFAATFGSPIAGAFVDLTQEYKISFYVFGSIFALSGLICVPLRMIKKWEDDRLDRKLRKEKYGVE